MSDFNVFYPEGKKIKIGGEEISIKPFVLANRTKVIRIIAEALLEYSKKNPNVSMETSSKVDLMGTLISSIIEVAGEKLVTIYEIATGKPKEWLLENVTMKNEVEIITSIQEVNDFPFLFSQVKGMVKSLSLQRTDSQK